MLVPYCSRPLLLHPFSWPHLFGLQVLYLCFCSPSWKWMAAVGQHPTTQKGDQIGIKNIVRIQREINAGGVTWCFFPQASCLHCWRLTQEGWDSDVLSVTERASVERHNSEETRTESWCKSMIFQICHHHHDLQNSKTNGWIALHRRVYIVCIWTLTSPVLSKLFEIQCMLRFSPPRKSLSVFAPLACWTPEALSLTSRSRNSEDIITPAGNTARTLNSPVIIETAETSRTPNSKGSCKQETRNKTIVANMFYNSHVPNHEGLNNQPDHPFVIWWLRWPQRTPTAAAGSRQVFECV